MRFSPTQLLQGLLCSTPLLVLALAACGGGGGGSTPTAPMVSSYTLGGAVSGVSGSGLVLRNNGGDDKSISSVDATYTFGTSVVAGKSYNVTVLTNPSNQVCSVVNASNTMPTSNVINANVTCVPAYTIGGATISGLTSSGLVLQNNGGDNLLVPANATAFIFSTPVAASGSYSVTVLSQPNTPARLFCTLANASGSSLSANVTNVSISCGLASPAPDRFAYTANFSDNTLSAYAIDAASGVLSPKVGQSTGNGPSAVAADAASHVYATKQSTNTISAFNITDAFGNLSMFSDVDAGTAGNQSSIPTGPTPVAIVIHPSGKFAYVVNSGSGAAADANSVSAYSIDATTGALARIDTNGAIGGTQYFIPTRVTPVSIAIDPAGAHAYVTNFDSGSITVYNIDPTSGALAEIQTVATGTDPYSIAIDPAGAYAYVTSWNTDKVYIFQIVAGGMLSTSAPVTVATGTGPRAIAIDSSGTHAYVVNSSSGDISVYTFGSSGALNQIDCTALLSSIGCNSGSNSQNFLAGASPISIAIDSSGQYAYVANNANSSNGNSVWAYSIAGSGALTKLGSSSTGLGPKAVTTVR